MLRVTEICEVAFEPHDEPGLGDRPVIEVPLHQRRVEAEVGGGEQADGAGALQVAVELEQVSGLTALRYRRRAPAFLDLSLVGRPNIGDGDDITGVGGIRYQGDLPTSAE